MQNLEEKVVFKDRRYQGWAEPGVGEEWQELLGGVSGAAVRKGCQAYERLYELLVTLVKNLSHSQSRVWFLDIFLDG